MRHELAAGKRSGEDHAGPRPGDPLQAAAERLGVPREAVDVAAAAKLLGWRAALEAARSLAVEAAHLLPSSPLQAVEKAAAALLGLVLAAAPPTEAGRGVMWAAAIAAEKLGDAIIECTASVYAALRVCRSSRCPESIAREAVGEALTCLDLLSEEPPAHSRT